MDTEFKVAFDLIRMIIFLHLPSFLLLFRFFSPKIRSSIIAQSAYPPINLMSSSTRRIEFTSLKINQTDFQVGDTVSINMHANSVAYAKILRIWRKPHGKDAFASIAWFYTPSEVFEEIPDFISQAELFATNHVQDVSVRTIIEKVTILGLSEYHVLDEVEDDVFFARAEYDWKTKIVTPPLEEWERLCYCKGIVNPDVVYVRCDCCSKLYHIGCSDYIPESNANWFCKNCLGGSQEERLD
jgi:hypothetical protein